MNIKPYEFLCDIKVLFSIQNLSYSYTGAGLSVSYKGCDKVFLNGHIVIGLSVFMRIAFNLHYWL